MDGFLEISSNNWTALQVLFADPSLTSAKIVFPVVDAQMASDRVCIVACDGSLADNCNGCPKQGEQGSIIPWILTTLAIWIITALLCFFCIPRPGQKQVRPQIEKVYYTDGSQELVTQVNSAHGQDPHHHADPNRHDHEKTYFFSAPSVYIMKGRDNGH